MNNTTSPSGYHPHLLRILIIYLNFVSLNSLISEIITLLAVRIKTIPLSTVAIINKINCDEYWRVKRTVGDIGSVNRWCSPSTNSGRGSTGCREDSITLSIAFNSEDEALSILCFSASSEFLALIRSANEN